MVLTIALGIVLGFVLLAASIWLVVFVAVGIRWVCERIKQLCTWLRRHVFRRPDVWAWAFLGALAFAVLMNYPAVLLAVVIAVIVGWGIVSLIREKKEIEKLRRYRELHPQGWRKR